jgi:hypothetical protein
MLLPESISLLPDSLPVYSFTPVGRESTARRIFSFRPNQEAVHSARKLRIRTANDGEQSGLPHPAAHNL